MTKYINIGPEGTLSVCPRVVVAKNKLDIWNLLDLRINNIYTFKPFCKKKK